LGTKSQTNLIMQNVTRILLVFAGICLLHTLGAQGTTQSAQEKTKLGLEIAKAQGENAVKLMAYSWTKSTKVYEKGEEKTHQLATVWFNADGKLESTMISSESASQQRPKRGVRGAIQSNQMKSFSELIAESMKQTQAYTTLSKGSWIDMMDRAKVEVAGAVIKVAAKDVLMPGDKALYMIDKSTKLIQSVEVSTTAQDNPIQSRMKYNTMEDGTNRVDVTEITIPSESIKIVTENIDFIKQK
jgi:hypothetical protein